MRAHGGDIHIRNMPGQGCVFVIDMPLTVEREATTSVAE
jgi:signal transduction histidine kinase